MKKLVIILFVLLLVNSAYIAALPSATVFYVANVLLHLVLGLAASVGLIWIYRSRAWLTALSLSAALAMGLYLTRFGATHSNELALRIHIGAALVGSMLLLAYLYRQSQAAFRAVAVGLALLLIVPAAVKLMPRTDAHITNPAFSAVDMKEEGGGPKSPFWPSSSKTNVGGTIPANFFMESKRCAECHKDVYDQWNSSVHHFASFNNQFYRKAIENMQDIYGNTQSSKFCAGCHDHAVFFNGRWERPIKEQIDTPEAQNGLGCMSCHSITAVHDTTGNGSFTMTYPPLHELASSDNKFMKSLNHFVTYLNPEPHRRTFLKPFMKESEYCSACHKVHLDVPINSYRWLRGFNDYDNWQASGVSGQGARSFYYPQKSSVCADCHMPLVPSDDPASRDGKVHSHRFPAANTAVAYANQDAAQLKTEIDFLKSGWITLDLFAASPVEDSGKDLQMRRRATDEGPQLNSTVAVGEEAQASGPVFLRDVGRITAPIDRAGAKFEPGSTVRVDTVVRTRKIGHFFPGGTIDTLDIWLELQAKDCEGKTIFWSGQVEDEGRGPVEKGAHFYRSFLLDADGNEINKRNAFQARAVLYVRQIPPGAADVAHYRIKIPKDAKGPVTLTAKLNYRKFTDYYTKYAYAGQPAAGMPPGLVDVNHDSRPFTFLKTNIPANVSGQIKDRIPEIPIVTLATAETKLPLAGQATVWQPVVQKKDRERWNDWGIGLLLQGDLKGAEYAFRKVTEAEPGYADGWLNVARALIQEGETDAAKPFIAKAKQIDPSLGRIYFFQAMTQKTDGDYDGAVESLRKVASMYPRDRVVQNQIGRVLFLQRKFPEAVQALQAALAVDPEDVQAHYNLMLCYRGLGEKDKAEREQKLFQRFKADESAQAITAKPRSLSPESNNERQPIHDHEGVVLK
jgi:Flp pilus assembly protein TadD